MFNLAMTSFDDSEVNAHVDEGSNTSEFEVSKTRPDHSFVVGEDSKFEGDIRAKWDEHVIKVVKEVR